jgi:hypothetical protein
MSYNLGGKDKGEIGKLKYGEKRVAFKIIASLEIEVSSLLDIIILKVVDKR